MTESPAKPIRPDVEAVKQILKPTPHALVPWISDDEIGAFLDMPGGEEELFKLHQERELLIERATNYKTGDPFTYGFDLDHWKDADDLLGKHDLIWVAGGKRASKSEWAAKRFARVACTYPQGVLWAFQDNLTSSRAVQQILVWKYLPAHIRKLNGQRSESFKIKWSLAGGFTEELVVLPNETKIHFLTYNQDPEDFQGWELGAYVSELVPGVPNVGAWCDENLTLPWLETLKMRCASRDAKVIWTFSVLHGITRTVKEFLGVPKVVQTRPASLLADRQNVDGCPFGHMPYIEKPTTEGSVAIYFHTELNPIGKNFEVVKKRCKGMPPDYIERNAYGYARDTMDRAWPLFGSHNIIEPEEAPELLTLYRFADPAGGRKWAFIWVGVDDVGRHYIYRDWPPAQKYGAWAKPDSSKNPNPDGVPGDAQRSLGWGVVQYKKELWRQEWVDTSGMEASRHPHQRRQLRRLWRESGENGEPSKDWLASLGNIQEPIQASFIDPRAGKNRKTAEKGGTCLIDEFARRQEVAGKKGEVEADPIHFRLASGVDIDDGLQAVDRLLYYNHREKLVPHLNEPSLYVTSNCKQVIWAMNNYTAEGGEKGACKDFADLVRYMALARLKYVDPGKKKTRGGGAY